MKTSDWGLNTGAERFSIQMLKNIDTSWCFSCSRVERNAENGKSEDGVKVQDKRLLLADGISPPHLHIMTPNAVTRTNWQRSYPCLFPSSGNRTVSSILIKWFLKDACWLTTILWRLLGKKIFDFIVLRVLSVTNCLKLPGILCMLEKT